MSDLLDKKITYGLTFRHILLMISGLIIASNASLTWFSYSNFGRLENLTGIDLSQRYTEFSEILVLPVIGAIVFFGTFVISRHEEFTAASRYPKYLAVLLGAITLILTTETALRLQLFIQTKIGISFFNNIGYGWYFAVGGAVITLIAATLPRKKSEKLTSKAQKSK